MGAIVMSNKSLELTPEMKALYESIPIKPCSFCGLSPSDFQSKDAELSTLKAENERLKARGKTDDGTCFSCGKKTSGASSNFDNLAQWRHFPKGNGELRCYCEGCISDALHRAERLSNRVRELESVIQGTIKRCMSPEVKLSIQKDFDALKSTLQKGDATK